MARDIVDAHAVESRDALVAWLEAGCKPAAQFRVGTEHEKIPFYRADLSPVPYEGDARDPRAARGHAARASAGSAIEDGGQLIGLFDAARRRRDLARARRPVRAFRRAARDRPRDRRRDSRAHLRLSHAVAEPLGIGFARARHEPEMDASPKRRPCRRAATGIMTRYMPKVGTRGLDMMFRTATVQANLDFSDEADMVAKLRVGARAAAGDHRAVRQFAVHRRQAQRLPLGALGDLARHRRGRAPACCRSPSSRAWASSATSITRSTCRCISSSAATSITTSPARASATCSTGRLAAAAGRARDDLRLGEPPVDDLSRGAAEALSRDARRRRRPAPSGSSRCRR